jgi:uncharacterized SAM-binding protein YcdF (DUF218 family)
MITSKCLVPAFICGLKCGLVLRKLWNYLVVNEVPKKADIIIVLSGGRGRLEYGIRLYQSGYANKMLFTGGSAHALRRKAIFLGVAPKNVLIEDKSNTTFGNAKNSLKIMQTQGFKSAIVVTSSYHTRRASVIFGQLFRGLDLTVCSVPYNLLIQDNWWKNSYTATIVISEYMNIVWHYLFKR